MEQGRLILASSPAALLVHVGNAASRGAFVLVWVAAAIYDHRRGPSGER